MKIIKILFPAILAIACTTALFAQSSRGSAHITTTLNELKIAGDSLLMDFDILVSNFSPSPSYELVLVPMVYNKENTLELAPVVLSGKRRAKLDRRLVSLRKQPRASDGYEHIVAKKSNGEYTVNYRASVFCEPWMGNSASLMLWADNCGCGNTDELLARSVVGDISLPRHEYRPDIVFVVPPKEEIKHRAESSTAYVTFEAGKSVVLPHFGNNAAELDKIRMCIDCVKDEATAKITSVKIVAFASPEGSVETNLALSRRRATALKEYVRTVCGFSANLMHSDGYGEDWGTLVDLIKEASQLENKGQILDIIATTESLDLRESRIKALSGGRPYRYMFDKYYPLLRRSDYVVSFTVPSFSIEKGKELLHTHPSMLSLEEMYHIANSYEKGSAEFREVFDIAVRLYPDDRIANFNAAAAALIRNDTEHAERILKNYEDDPGAWNYLGVLRTLQDRYEEAEVFLNKAQAAGSVQAANNLWQLNEMKRIQGRFTK